MVVTWDPVVIFIFIRGCELIEDPGDCMVIGGRKSRLGVMVTMGIGGSVRGMADKVGGKNYIYSTLQASIANCCINLLY